jgi:hypothetical protein
MDRWINNRACKVLHTARVARMDTLSTGGSKELQREQDCWCKDYNGSPGEATSSAGSTQAIDISGIAGAITINAALLL